LPRAFANADLRANVGWKAQLEAAERLSRAGAISDNALLGLYTARVPAASGGVWERAKAVNALIAALAGDDPETTSRTVSDLWSEARAVGVAVPLARVFAGQLIDADVGRASDVVFTLLLLSDQYEQAALNEDLAATDPFLAAVARGDPSEASPVRANYPLIQDAFATEPDAALVAMASQGRTGEAILRALATLQQGIDGDQIAFKEGFATLRALGLEDVARRVALQYLLLP
jgi:nucleotide-binding universal stress UspA family protein